MEPPTHAGHSLAAPAESEHSRRPRTGQKPFLDVKVFYLPACPRGPTGLPSPVLTRYARWIHKAVGAAGSYGQNFDHAQMGKVIDTQTTPEGSERSSSSWTNSADVVASILSLACWHDNYASAVQYHRLDSSRVALSMSVRLIYPRFHKSIHREHCHQHLPSQANVLNRLMDPFYSIRTDISNEDRILKAIDSCTAWNVHFTDPLPWRSVERSILLGLVYGLH